MARTRSPGRLEVIVEAAIAVFTRVGYRNAQVADIAKEAGVSAGTIYLYVEGKEALFWLALKKSAHEQLPSVEDGPIKSKPIKETLGELAERLQTRSHSPLLVKAASLSIPEGRVEDELRA